MTDRVVDHYASQGIAERVLAAFRAAAGPEALVTPEALAFLDHFHGRGPAATEELAALLAPRAGERVLDIGCGLGGPARWLAARHGCEVTGVELTPDFVAAAAALTRATGLEDRVRVIEGSALALPVPDGAFDRAWSQNVMMNVADRAGFLAEARRALKPGGLLALADIGAGPGGPPHYPLPWATTPATSFLVTPEALREALLAAGFEVLEFRDRTAEHLPGQRKLLARLEEEGLPRLGWHVFMGEARAREMQANVARSYLEGRLASVEALARRP